MEQEYTITVNGSMQNIHVSGRGHNKEDVTWKNPTLPDNAVIISTKFTASFNCYATFGNGVNYSVNGTTYKKSTDVSIDLGTTLSNVIHVDAWGTSFFSVGNLKCSNAVYTVVYRIATNPIVTIINIDKFKISRKQGLNECLCTFKCDIDIALWEARATRENESSGHGIGLLVESGTNLMAGDIGTVSVLDTELSNGDGDYIIRIYAKSTDGLWSDG